MTVVTDQPVTPVAPGLEALPVAIVGAGPIGLAAAAHLAERGVDFVILEAGESVASSVKAWGHIRLFSPWKHVIDPASRRLLESNGWTPPRDEDAAPSGSELVTHYLSPLAALEPIVSRLRLGVAVEGVTRRGMDRTRTARRAATPFALRLRDSSGALSEFSARAVIDASGTYQTSNSLGANGLDPLGSADVADRVTTALPDVLGADRSRFSGKHTVVIGAGHSAVNTIINLATLIQTSPSTTVSWVIRGDSAARVFTSDDDELSGRASLGARVQRLVNFGVITLVNNFETVELASHDDRVDIIGERNGHIERITADLIVNATGFRPNLQMLREVRLDLDEVVEAPRRLAPLIDPNVHTCGTVEPHGFTELQQPEPNFFLAGMKSYGRAPTFLLATGYEQVRSIVAYLAGDVAAARSLELVLPATGVCSTSAAESCCTS